MKLFSFWRSLATYRVRIALNLKGLAWDSVPIDLRAGASAQHSPEFRRANPEGLVPVLEDQGVEKFAVSWNELLDTIKTEMAGGSKA